MTSPAKTAPEAAPPAPEPGTLVSDSTTTVPTSPALPEVGRATPVKENGHPAPRPSRLPRGRYRLLLLIGVPVLALLTAGAAVWFLFPGFRSNRTDLITHEVKREKLLLTIVERGQLESANNNDIICRVKARNTNSTVSTTIKWVIDDGSHVKPGELLVQLDDSGLKELAKTQQIPVEQARAAWTQAEEAYKIQMSQNYSELKTAEVKLQLAQIDLQKYVKGDYEKDRADIQTRLEMTRDRSAWAERMVKKGYLTPSQALAESSRL